jgi:hypothetical protein
MDRNTIWASVGSSQVSSGRTGSSIGISHVMPAWNQTIALNMDSISIPLHMDHLILKPDVICEVHDLKFPKQDLGIWSESGAPNSTSCRFETDENSISSIVKLNVRVVYSHANQNVPEWSRVVDLGLTFWARWNQTIVKLRKEPMWIPSLIEVIGNMCFSACENFSMIRFEHGWTASRFCESRFSDSSSLKSIRVNRRRRSIR